MGQTHGGDLLLVLECPPLLLFGLDCLLDLEGVLIHVLVLTCEVGAALRQVNEHLDYWGLGLNIFDNTL